MRDLVNISRTSVMAAPVETWPYSEVHVTAHLSLYLQVIGSQKDHLPIISSNLSIQVYQNPVYTLQSLYISFIKAWRATGINVDNPGTYFNAAISDIMPGYDVPSTTIPIPNSAIIISADLRYTVPQLNMFRKAYAPIYFLPTSGQDIERQLVREIVFDGYVSLESRNMEDIQKTLMGIFNLTTTQIYYSQQIPQVGFPMMQDRRKFYPGVITGLHKDFDRRYQMVFYIKETMSGEIRANIRESIVPYWHYQTMGVLPEKVKMTTQVRIYPRHTTYTDKIIQQIFSATTLSFMIIPGAQLDKKIRAIVSPIGFERSKVVIDSAYDSQGIVVSTPNGEDTPYARLALCLVLYVHLIPSHTKALYFKELVVVTGHIEPIEMIHLRTKWQGLDNYAKKVVFRINNNKILMGKRKITMEDDILRKVGIEIVDHPDPAIGKVFLTSDGVYTVSVSLHTSFMYIKPQEDGPTTVTRNYMTLGDVINSSGGATNAMSSSNLHGPYTSFETHKVRTKEKGESSATLKDSHKMVSSTTSVLFVKGQQNQVFLVGASLMYNVYYSPKFGRLVMVEVQDIDVTLNVYERRDRYNSFIPKEEQESYFGVGLRRAPVIPPEEDHWYNFINIGPLDVEVNQTDVAEFYEYYFAIINMDKAPFIFVVNLDMKPESTTGMPITLQTDHVIEGALKIPFIKSVGNTATKAPEGYPMLPSDRKFGKIRQEFRFPRPGVCGTIDYNNLVLRICSTPIKYSFVHAVLMHTDEWTGYARKWYDTLQAGVDLNDFSKSLIDQVGLAAPFPYEMWYMRGFGNTLYDAFELLEGHFAEGEPTNEALRLIDMLEVRTGLDIYLMTYSKKNVEDTRPKQAPHGVRKSLWAIVERRDRVGRLWERTGRRAYVGAMVPLSHTHPRGDARHFGIAVLENERAVDSVVEQIPVLAPIPTTTKVVVFDNNGLPIAALTGDLKVLQIGNMSLRRNVNYVHWQHAEILIPRSSNSSEMYASLYGPNIYYAQESEVLAFGGVYYLSMHHIMHYTTVSANLLTRMTGYAPVGLRPSQAVPARIPRFGTYAGNKEAYKKFYENCGIVFADEPSEVVDDQRKYPTFLPMPSTVFASNNPDEGLHDFYFIDP